MPDASGGEKQSWFSRVPTGLRWLLLIIAGFVIADIVVAVGVIQLTADPGSDAAAETDTFMNLKGLLASFLTGLVSGLSTKPDAMLRLLGALMFGAAGSAAYLAALYFGFIGGSTDARDLMSLSHEESACR